MTPTACRLFPVAGICLAACAAFGAIEEPGLSDRTAAAASNALDRGTAWLLARQTETGSWSNPHFPALTALPLWALARSGDSAEPVRDAMRRAVDFIVSCAHRDGPHKGAIYREVQDRRGGGLMNYNTALCMTALHATGNRSLAPVILAARSFLAKSQFLGQGDFAGGMGYDPPTGRPYTDLSNSYLAFEAMRLTQDIEDLRPHGSASADLDWSAALRFIQRCHNDPDYNEMPWTSSHPDEQGGFAYHPQQTRAGTHTGDDGIVRFRSMPGMTYAGLLSYIYAGLDRDDPRVLATVRWVARNWSLDVSSRDPENRDTPAAQEGLFFMYNCMARGLSAFGQDCLRRPDGDCIRWRELLADRLVSLQNADGSWVNANGRYWESDAVLVTAYALHALQSILGQ